MPQYETTYTEQTFKKSKWTVFRYWGDSQTSLDYFAIQAPRGVAEDIMRKNGFDLEERDRYDELQTRWSIHTDVENPWEMLSWNSKASMLCIHHDCIGYLDSGYWYIDHGKVKSRF